MRSGAARRGERAVSRYLQLGLKRQSLTKLSCGPGSREWAEDLVSVGNGSAWQLLGLPWADPRGGSTSLHSCTSFLNYEKAQKYVV
jgi:hypothetical protein